MSLMLNLSQISEMVELIKYGQENFPNFEYGGFSMLAAGLYIRSSFHSNPGQGIVLLEQMQARGVEDYMVYLMKAEAQASLGKKEEARRTLQEAIDQIENRITKKNFSYFYNIEITGILYMLQQSQKNLVFSGFAPIKK